jgi:hypothetical protein
MGTTNNTALVKAEPRLERTHDGRGRDRTIARGANGKFVKKSIALAADNAKRVSKVMFTPDEKGTTRLEKILESQAAIAESNTNARNLGQVASFLETADELSGAKLIRTRLAKDPEPQNAVKVILVSTPELMFPEFKHDSPAPVAPKFVEAEILSTND